MQHIPNSFPNRGWNEIGAKQKQLRQKLGLDNSTNSRQPNSRQERGSIPSIDGDDTTEHLSQERNFKARTTYFDDAEESLQFFKRNLLEKSETRPKLPIKPIIGPTSGLKTSESNTKPKSYSRYDDLSSVTPSYPKYDAKPLPIKVAALRDSRPPRSEKKDNNSPVVNSNVSQNRTQKLQTNLDNDLFHLHQDVDKDRAIGNHHMGKLSPTAHVENRSDSADRMSPTQNEPFSRRPIYNSLLRAHDSIRLKINRPKIRPKSDKKVEDTEIEDTDLDALDALDSNTRLNERGIDVRHSSRKSKKKAKDKTNADEEQKVPTRNFSDVRVVKVVRSEEERSLGVTVRVEDGNIEVARIMAGSLADRQGALQVGDIILSVNNREVYTPEQLQEELRRCINDDTVLLKIVPSLREELPTLCIYLRALFSYDANEDSLLPCKEVGVSFNQGDILEVVNQEDPNWWQARRVDSESLQTGLIPSQELEERRRAFVLPDYDLATRTSICGTRVTRKSKKKEIYNIGQNNDFDRAELQLYEEVCRTPAFERRTLVLIGANGVGKQAFKTRLITNDPERFASPLAHTSRLPRDGEEDGVHYHFVTRERMEEDIIEGKYLEYGEYDGALYGTKLDSVREIIGSGKVCVLDCSPNCLKILKTADYLPFVAFIAAPTLDQLRYMQDWARGNKTYNTFDRALSRQSRRARTLQDFAFDFFEDEDLQLTVEESARLFRIYENYFDIVLVNNHFEKTFDQLREAIDSLSMAPQWIPISWIYGT